MTLLRCLPLSLLSLVTPLFYQQYCFLCFIYTPAVEAEKKANLGPLHEATPLEPASTFNILF
jgi:hypothetical protein